MSKTYKDQLRRVSILEAHEQLCATKLFCVAYAWTDKLFGELTGHTVVDACDAESALRSFRSQHRHCDRCWIVQDQRDAGLQSKRQPAAAAAMASGGVTA